jgi:hypothetical protein
MQLPRALAVLAGFLVIAGIGLGLYAQTSTEKKQQRHAMAMSLADRMKKVAESKAVTGSWGIDQKGHYGQKFTMATFGSEKMVVGFAQDNSDTTAAVVGLKPPGTDSLTLRDADVSGYNINELNGLTNNMARHSLMAVMALVKSGYSHVHTEDDYENNEYQSVGVKNGSEMMVVTATQDQAVIIYENSSSRFFASMDLSEHEAVPLHSSEKAQPIDPHI